MSALNLPQTQSYKVKKVLRSFRIHGLSRTFIKLIGRFRRKIFNILKPFLFFRFSKIGPERTVSFIGCGQATFTCIAFFLKKFTKAKLESTMDISLTNAQSFGEFYNLNFSTNKKDEFFAQLKSDLVYIATNHSTHCEYAISAMDKGADVYVEKPLVTSYEQLVEIGLKKMETGREVYVGYNRPFSKAIREISSSVSSFEEPFSLGFYIIGHFIPEDHWYRNPEEGTRVCGNLGHWLDLPVHMLYWRNKKPTSLKVDITYSDEKYLDENLALTITSDIGDLINIAFTARSEPFEGVYEFVNLQWGDLIVHIDDFRSMKMWSNDKKVKRHYWPKDVGHKTAVMQPFMKEKRNWEELEVSTILMLFIKDMVLERETSKTFNISEKLSQYYKEIGANETSPSES